MKIHTTGIAWYKEDQYDDFKKLCEDGFNLPDTHAAWLRQADEGAKSLAAKGHRIMKVTIDIDEFRVFCAAHGNKFDSEGRGAFVNFKVAVALGFAKE